MSLGVDGGEYYHCPQGMKPCVDAFLESRQTQEFTICVPEAADREKFCPITAIAFSLDGMEESEKLKYYKAQEFEENELNLADFYVSKTVLNHPVDEIVIKASHPCWMREEFNIAEN